MNYEGLLRRTWNVVWNNKFLIILGSLVALGTGGGGGSNFNYSQSGPGPSTPGGEYQLMPNIPDNFGELQEMFDDLGREFEEEVGIPFRTFGALIFGFFALVLLIALALWVVAVIARGGLIVGVNEIETVGSSGFGQAWGAAWQRGWRLIGINLVPAIPTWIMLLVGGGVFLTYFGSAVSWSDALEDLVYTGSGPGILIGMGTLGCMGIIVGIALDILRTFAERACMIEDKLVFDSYGRGWEVLRNNFGEAILLFLIQIALSIALWIVLFVPSCLMAMCCLAWPLLLAIEGAIKTYVLTMWTLAWREWTGITPGEQPALEEAPAV